ncbi:MAG: MlaD family protein, partial [Myxococcota bacterium]
MAKTKGKKRTRFAGIVAVAFFLLFAYVAVTKGTKMIEDEKIVTLYVTDALGLVDNSAVMIAGVEVGYVKN